MQKFLKFGFARHAKALIKNSLFNYNNISGLVAIKYIPNLLTNYSAIKHFSSE